MSFNISDATSQSSLNQLFQAYADAWDAWEGEYTIVTLYNLWYYTNTVNSTIVNCRAYYQYTGIESGYWCNDMEYDTTSGLYTTIIPSGVPASSSSNGLSSDDLQELTLFYTNTACFKKDTKILTDTGYKLIQDLRKGDLVKTLKNNYKAIDMIGKREIYHPALQERIKDQLYQYTNDNFDEIFEPLVITGGHSILVDSFTDEEQKQKTIKVFGKICVTDKKYRLPVCVDSRATIYETYGTYTIYHLALESNNYYMNYGIYANGLLVESCSKQYLKKVSNMTLIE